MGMFVDLSKGFDTIHHQILSKNLKKCVAKKKQYLLLVKLPKN